MKLNIGGQKGRNKGNFKGWSIVDIRKGAEFRLDIMNKNLPFKDNSVEAIYSSHTLEHIFPDKLPFVLKEWHRVLRPGAAVRIVVPDVQKAIQAYVDGDISYLKDKRNPSKLEFLPSFPIAFLSSWFFTYKSDQDSNKRLIGGHVMAFDWDILKHYVAACGFKEITRETYGNCRSIFTGCDFQRYRDCSLYVEATKSRTPGLKS